MINYWRLFGGTSSPYSHTNRELRKFLIYANLLAAILLVNFVSSRFARFGGLLRHSWFCFRQNKFSLRISFPPSSSFNFWFSSLLYFWNFHDSYKLYIFSPFAFFLIFEHLFVYNLYIKIYFCFYIMKSNFPVSCVWWFFGDICLFYKIIYGLVAIDMPPYVVHPLRTPRNLHTLCSRQIQSTVDYYKYSFCPLLIVQWNRLPAHIALLPTFDSFNRAVCTVSHPMP